ncbi:hypothetical protein [Rhizocola hellebori]|uniref:hypothetical protein n=1 Tax=Rhizocola hellebori TaxID=1392758 RepID=UPI001941C26A|nr:hypothetical protein [Rhizocola hellebori]
MSTRDTVGVDTPARRAISAIVGSSLRLPRLGPLGIVPVTRAVYDDHQNGIHTTSADTHYAAHHAGVLADTVVQHREARRHGILAICRRPLPNGRPADRAMPMK